MNKSKYKKKRFHFTFLILLSFIVGLLPGAVTGVASETQNASSDENIISLDVMKSSSEGIDWSITLNKKLSPLLESSINIEIDEKLIYVETLAKSAQLTVIEKDSLGKYFTKMIASNNEETIEFRTNYKDEITTDFIMRASLTIKDKTYIAEKKVVIDKRVNVEELKEEEQLLEEPEAEEPILEEKIKEEPVIGEPGTEEPNEEETKTEELTVGDKEEELILGEQTEEEPLTENPTTDEPVSDDLMEDELSQEIILEQESEGADDYERIPWKNIMFRDSSKRLATNRTLMTIPQNYINNNNGQYPDPFTQGINYRNPDPSRIEVDEGFITKKASNGTKDGEFYIDLKIEGKQITNTETVDVVLVLDNSGSMGNGTRRKNANDAAKVLINGLLDGNTTNKMALVTYGSDLKPGNSLYALTDNEASLIAKLPSDTGGYTFTQAALLKASEIIATSTATKKFIVLISDGIPTKSYKATQVYATPSGTYGPGFVDYNGVTNDRFIATQFSGTVGSGNYQLNSSYTAPVNPSGSFTIKNNGFATMSQALLIKRQTAAPTIYTVGVELAGEFGASVSDSFNIMKNIASSESNYFDASKSNKLSNILSDITTSIQKKINSGSVIDPMSSMVNLNRGTNGLLDDSDYTLTASVPALLNTVTVEEDPSGTLKLTGLNLGANEWVNLQYKINLKTEEQNFIPDFYYLSNERTYLIPTIGGTERDFGIPAVKGLGVDIEGSKKWVGGIKTNRPESIKIRLFRESSAVQKNEFKDITLLKSDFVDTDIWTYSFMGLAEYDNLGNKFTYTIEEDSVPGYTSLIEGYAITNTYEIPLTSFTATKQWVGGTKPLSEVRFQLLQNGEASGTPVSLTGLTYTWDNLVVTDIDGNAYEYSFEESTVPANYTVTYSEDGLTAINTYTSPTTGSFTATKQWVGGTKPLSEVRFQLLQNDVALGSPVELEGLTYTWDNLVVTDIDGNAYEYSFEESTVPANYTVTYSEDGLTAINTYTSPTTGSFTATKVWVGGPKPIIGVKFQLYRAIGNENPVTVGDPVQLTENSYTWNELEQTNLDGVEYIYSFKESTIPANYTATYSENTVTNTYNPPVIDDPPSPASVTITATKTMDGATPTDGEFTFELVNDENFVQQTKANSGQSITFDSLLFERIGTFKYTVREVTGTDETINYDDTIYSVIVNVTRNNNGDYEASVTYLADDITFEGNLVFKNQTKELPNTGGEEEEEEPEEEPGKLPNTGGGEKPKPSVPDVKVEKPVKIPNTGGSQQQPNQLPKTGETQTTLPIMGVIMILGGMVLLSLRKKRIK